jgi:hypothetical protein
MSRARLHPLHFFNYIQYAVVLCAVPVIQELLEWDLPGAWAALWQGFAILAGCLVLTLVLWRTSRVALTDGVVSVAEGLVLRRTAFYRKANISAVELRHPLWLAPFGAAELFLFFTGGTRLRRVKLVLPRGKAAELARTLLPLGPTRAAFAPAGMGRLQFVLLSANVAATGFFTVTAANRISQLIGEDVGALALGGLQHAGQLLALFLPAGLSVLAAVVLFFFVLSLIASWLRTFRFSAGRFGDILVYRGGLLNRTERRIRVSCITAATLKISPLARVLRRRPLYLRAGTFAPTDLPLLMVQRGNAQTLYQLLPELNDPPAPTCEPRRKSPGQYLWRPGSLSLLLAALFAVAQRILPGIAPLLGVLLALALAGVACGVEALFKEGAAADTRGRFALCYTRALTRYDVLLLTTDRTLSVSATPPAQLAGRCNLRVRTPSRKTLLVRSLPLPLAQTLAAASGRGSTHPNTQREEV